MEGGLNGKHILLLGGTGAMGMNLICILSKTNAKLYVTSREERMDGRGTVQYIKGNAKNKDFLKDTLEIVNEWDVIVDFMTYSTAEFSERVDLLINNTKQYIFISSARVYADTKKKITEDSNRLLDVCKNVKYLKTDEYALAKARQENILFASKRKNWTIVRPSLTYSRERLQLGVYEKENWLKRAIDGKTVVFSKDLIDKYYTMSDGFDVAQGIFSLMGQEKALGEAYHITMDRSYQWRQILELYMDILEESLGVRPKLVMTEKCTNIQIGRYLYQVLYGRYYDRNFDNSKISKFVDTSKFKDLKEGLAECMKSFLEKPDFKEPDYMIEALLDKAAKEHTKLNQIPTFKKKVQYILYRYGFGPFVEMVLRIC